MVGQLFVGTLYLAGTVRARLRRQAKARGVTPLTLAREWLSERVMREPDPDPPDSERAPD